MNPLVDRHARRYRRRVVAWGAALVIAIVVVGSLVALPRVERDLERRVEAALDVAGHTGWSVSFSGQDGTLDCPDGVGTDPAGAVAVASSIRGVRSVALGDRCGGTPDGGDGAATVPTTAAPPAPSSPSSSSTTVPALTVPPTTEPDDADTITAVIADTPSLSQFESLVEFAGLGDRLAGDGPLTVFAPTDEAFDALSDTIGPDAFTELTTDVEVVERIVLDHVAAGRLGTDVVPDGPVDTLGGDPLLVDVGPPFTVTSRDVVAGVDAVGDLDIEASNGVVHAINQVLLPPDLELAAPPGEPVVSVRWSGGRLAVSGAVASVEQRTDLLAGVAGTVDAANLVDQLAVEPSAVVTDDEVARIATLGAALPVLLVEADLELVGGRLVVNGVAASETDAERMSQLALDAAADVELVPRPTADAVSAAELTSAVNAEVVADPILFTVDSATLEPSAAPVLDRVAARLRTLGGVRITVVGHTDSSGDTVANLVLSERRATSVVAALVERGLPRELFDTEARGDTEPIIDPATGREDRAASRRVEFVVASSG